MDERQGRRGGVEWVGKRLIKLLDVNQADNIGLEFQVHLFF